MQRPQSPGDGRHPGYAPRIVPTPPPERPRRATVWRVPAAVALGVAAITCLGYGVWAMTERRGVFADLAAGESVSAAAAQDSDRLNVQLLTGAVVTIVVAMVLWLLAHRLSRRPLGTAGFTAVALLLTGGSLALGGAYVTSLVDGRLSEADKAAVGFLVLGGGFLLIGSGTVAALVALFRRRRSDTLVAGFAGWQAQ